MVMRHSCTVPCMCVDKIIEFLYGGFCTEKCSEIFSIVFTKKIGIIRKL